MIMHNALFLRYEIDRLYMSRKEWRRELTSIEYCIDASKQGLEEYIKKNKEKLIKATNNSNADRDADRKTIKTRKQK